jgi:HK97 gp10 family phage protein
MTQVRVHGMQELSDRIKTVSDDLRYKGGRFALRKAATLVQKAAKQNAQQLDDVETGRSIAKNIAIRWDGRRFKATGNLAFRLGVLHGAVLAKPGQPVPKEAGAPTPHWRLVELGTEKMPARSFLRRAAAENVEAFMGEFVQQYGKALDRAIKKGKS